MEFLSSYELDIQGNVPGVLRDPATLAKIVEEFNTRPLEQVTDARQRNRVPSRKISNKDTSGRVNQSGQTPDMIHASPVNQSVQTPSSANGKKRALSPENSDSSSRKRMKLDEDFYDTAVDYSHRIRIKYTTLMEQPALPKAIRDLCTNVKVAFQNVDSIPIGPLYLHAGIPEQSRGSRAPTSIVFGTLRPVVSKSGKVKMKAEDYHFLRLPDIIDNINSNHYNLTPVHRELLFSLLTLASADRGELSATLSLSPVTDGSRAKSTSSDGEFQVLPDRDLFCLNIDINFTFTDFSPPSTAQLLEAQRRATISILPTSTNTPMLAPTVSGFISHLKPAAPLPPHILPSFVQPKELAAKLYPFQLRSLYWLLGLEGGTVNPSTRAIEAAMPIVEDLFWDQVVMPSSGKTRFINRLTGELYEERPEIEQPRGGILSEEPGLGKTLECIGLILLNPRPERAPDTRHWVEEMRLTVFEVKSTLIVTPSSLLPQWVNEIEKHAPSLSVFVFDGWTQIRKQVALTPLDRKAIEAKKQKKAKGRPKKKPLKKKVKQVDDDGEEDDEDNFIETPAKGEKKWKGKGTRPVVEEELSENEGYVPQTDEPIDDWARFCNEFDIVITSYATLSKELGVARGSSERPRRLGVEYGDENKPRSPLVGVEWARVIMDEVQMAGGHQTVQMVSLLPRQYSFAVSGTPARGEVDDLRHVLEFLRYRSVTWSTKVWKNLLAPAYQECFHRVFGKLTVRTCKDQVTSEFTLPKQTRFVVPIELGRVERTVYDETLETALQHLRMDARGVAAHDGWEIDIPLLRIWLHKLRQVCTHPQVGNLNQGHGGGRVLGGALKTMEEVLHGLKEQSSAQLFLEKKRRILLRIRYAQLLASQELRDRATNELVLETLRIARVDVLSLGGEVEADVIEHATEGEELKKEVAEKRKARQEAIAALAEDDALAEPSAKAKGKRKAADSDAEPEDSGDEGEEDKKIPKTPAGHEWRTKSKALFARRREIVLLKHQAELLLGDVFFVLQDSENEKKYYDVAEETRASFLRASETAAVTSMENLPLEMTKLAEKVKDRYEHGLPSADNLQIEEPVFTGGISTGEVLEKLEDVTHVLNEQANVLFEWRDKIVELLTQKLIDDSVQEENGPSPYERAAIVQAELESYMQAYESLLFDRKEALVAERVMIKPREKERKTKASKKASEFRGLEKSNYVGDKELLVGLDQRRMNLVETLKGSSMKSIISELQALLDKKLTQREEALCESEIDRLKAEIKKQSKQMGKLEPQMVPIRKTYNDRVTFFKQLQELSDAVSPVDFEGALEGAIQECLTDCDKNEQDMQARQARHRYLEQVQQIGQDVEDNGCVMCRDEIKRGIMLSCAHYFCERCLLEWHARNKHCPVCRTPIERSAIQRINMGQPTVAPEDEYKVNDFRQRKSRQTHEYNLLPEEDLKAILEIDLESDRFGSKINFLVRHLLWLQQKDSNIKSVVFSAWADGLHIVSEALRANDVSFLRIDHNLGKKFNAGHEFQTNPHIKVLLLHGERENAGLSITSACRVFLLEPTVNHNFELQAIARVDRLGQERQTEVYCYATESTVEKNILDLGARKGLSLFTKDSADTMLDIMKYSEQDKQPVDGAKKLQKKGDFIAKADDMLACLFPHLYDGFADETDEVVRGIGEEAIMSSENAGDHSVGLDLDTDMPDASQMAGPSGWSGNLNVMASSGI